MQRTLTIFLFNFLAVVCLPTLLAADFDGDTIPDEFDNCLEVPNIEQRDSDGDGFGNRCDSDLNNDCVTNSGDLNIFRDEIFRSTLKSDFNDDGIVDNIDAILLKNMLFKPVGPSGIGICK